MRRLLIAAFCLASLGGCGGVYDASDFTPLDPPPGGSAIPRTPYSPPPHAPTYR